ncbi:MAG TPA: hypothetical protein VIW29_23460 [Polyangiaceae bacterium]
MFARLGAERSFLTILVLALLLPLCTSRVRDVPFIGLPLVTSGDEPHYLLMIHSLIADHDLDLRNNYDAARAGSVELSVGRVGAPLDHQVAFFDADGKWRNWDKVFEYPKAADGKILPAPTQPQLKPGAPPELLHAPQYSQHPAGLPLLLAPVLLPFAGTTWVEHLAVLASTLATLGTALALRELFRALTPSLAIANGAALLVVLGSPLWHYGRTLFCEPWLALSAVGALALVVRRDAYFWAGLVLAIGIQMKPPFALLAVPLVIDRLLARKLTQAALFSLPVGLATLLVLWQNQLFFGSPLRSAQPWESGNPLTGLANVLLSGTHGLIPFCPLVLVALWGFPALLRSHRRLAWLTLGMAVPYLLLMSLWYCWWGGYCYGPRLITPVIPLLLLGLVPVLDRFTTLATRARRLIVATSALSLLISALGAIVHLAFWEKHPLVEPFVALAKTL